MSLVDELGRLHKAAKGCEFDLRPTDGPIAQLTLFMHENGDRILAALRSVEHEREECAKVAENCIKMISIGTPGTGPFTRDDQVVDEVTAIIAAAIRA